MTTTASPGGAEAAPDKPSESKPAAKKPATARTAAKKAPAHKPPTKTAAEHKPEKAAPAPAHKPAAKKAAPKKAAAKPSVTTVKSAGDRPRTNGKPTAEAPAKTGDDKAAKTKDESAIRSWFERLTDFELPTLDLGKVELPAIDLPQLDLPRLQLPTPDDVRMSVVRALDGVQDAVMTAPGKAQEFAADLKETVSKSITLIREAVGL